MHHQIGVHSSVINHERSIFWYDLLGLVCQSLKPSFFHPPLTNIHTSHHKLILFFSSFILFPPFISLFNLPVTFFERAKSGIMLLALKLGPCWKQFSTGKHCPSERASLACVRWLGDLLECVCVTLGTARTIIERGSIVYWSIW